MPYANNRGVSVFYEVSGEGTPFVMLHANPCDHRMWMFQAARFSNNFKAPCSTGLKFLSLKDLKPFKIVSKFQEASRILKVCYALSK